MHVFEFTTGPRLVEVDQRQVMQHKKNSGATPGYQLTGGYCCNSHLEGYPGKNHWLRHGPQMSTNSLKILSAVGRFVFVPSRTARIFPCLSTT